MTVNKNVSIKFMTVSDMARSGNEFRFRIPIYQRRYAWTEREVEQLIRDIVQHWEGQKEKPYFIGNIVVEDLGGNRYDVIDGQQRLTTLYLLLVVARQGVGQNMPFLLDYGVRQQDGEFLKRIGENKDIEFDGHDWVLANGIFIDAGEISPNFRSSINTICKKELWNSGKEIKPGEIWSANTSEISALSFQFSLTILPPGRVDVAKYFEVMNSRGKQLEKYQILKARFLEGLSDDERSQYGRIWDCCSQMDCYVEELFLESSGHAPELRADLIEYASSGVVSDALRDMLFPEVEHRDRGGALITIEECLERKTEIGLGEAVKGVKVYRSPIKFESLILHVLAYLNRGEAYGEGNVSVSGKNLLEHFPARKGWLESGDKKKEFIQALLRLRIVLDYWAFKRDETDKPVVVKLRRGDRGIAIERTQGSNDDCQAQLLNLQLLFSYTTDYFSQDWIQQVFRFALSYGGCVDDLEGCERKLLEHLLKVDRLVALGRLDLIKKVGGGSMRGIYYLSDLLNDVAPDRSKLEKRLRHHLNKGTSTNHYWFYRLEYALWKGVDWDSVGRFRCKFSENEKFKYGKIKTGYRMSRLSSVEHIWPQSKSKEGGWKGDGKCNKKCHIDCFGNLALISAHMNSALSNESENKKNKVQQQLNRGTIESLKMLYFYSNINGSEEVTPGYCKEHGEEMLCYLTQSLFGEGLDGKQEH